MSTDQWVPAGPGSKLALVTWAPLVGRFGGFIFFSLQIDNMMDRQIGGLLLYICVS